MLMPRIQISDKLLPVWKDKLIDLNSNKNTILNIAGIGDSITAQTSFDTGWIDCLNLRYATKYENSGKGLIPAMTGQNVTVPVNVWNFNGAWSDSNATLETADDTGGICTFNRSTTDATATANLHFYGHGIDIWYKTTPEAGDFTVTIDGVLIDIVSCDAISAAHNYQVTSLNEGGHDLIIAPTDTTIINIVGAVPKAGNYGVRCHHFGIGGATSTQGADTLSLDYLDFLEPDVFIISYGANDYFNRVPIIDFKENMNKIINKGLETGEVILTTMSGIQNTNQSYLDPLPDEYLVAIRELAIENNIAIMDIARRWGGSHTSANQLGMVTSDVHPTTAGYNDISKAVWGKLALPRTPKLR